MDTAMEPQEQFNRAVYTSPRIDRSYRSELLDPAEIACLLKYQPSISGKSVLDIGVGTGRTTRYIEPLAARYEAVDYSPVMISFLRKTMPEISANLADFRDLSIFPDSSLDFIFAPNNVLDALPHSARLEALREAHRIVRPAGKFALSCHNLNYANSLAGPRLNWSSNPVRLSAAFLNYLISLWHHAKVRRFREIYEEYALLNDPGHRYACLHYYATPATVITQLAGAGFQVIDIFDTSGRSLPWGAEGREHSSLMYVSQPLDNS